MKHSQETFTNCMLILPVICIRIITYIMNGLSYNYINIVNILHYENQRPFHVILNHTEYHSKFLCSESQFTLKFLTSVIFYNYCAKKKKKSSINFWAEENAFVQIYSSSLPCLRHVHLAQLILTLTFKKWDKIST